MPKKFFDIVPPEKANPSRLVLRSKKGFLSVEEEDLEPKVVKKTSKKNPFFIKKIHFIFGALALAGVAYIFFITPPPKIEVNAKIADVELSASVGGDKISIKTFNDEREVSGTFSSTGEAVKEAKARGIITVYNSASSEPRQLIPSRFVSSDGKIFKSLKVITIPGAKGKATPGQADVEVEAMEAGESYNIGPTTFALPALAGSPLYTAIYAKSFSIMSGGGKTKISQIKKEDFESAKASLLLSLKKNSFEYLSKNLPDGFILIDSAIAADITKEESAAKVGDKVPSFSYKIKGKCIGFAFSKSEVESFSANFLTENISKGVKIQKGTFQVFPLVESISKADSKIIFSLKIKAKALSNINLPELRGSLAGKTINDSESILKNNSAIGDFKITNRFFWNNNFPKDPSQIDIKLITD